MAYDLRTVVCIPLRKRQVQAEAREQTPAVHGALGAEVMGVYNSIRDLLRVNFPG